MLMVAIAADERRLVSAVNLLEARMVMRGRYGEPGHAALQDLLEAIAADIVPFDEVHATLAYAAFVAYGKGMQSRQPTELLRLRGLCRRQLFDAPLLFKGDDFRATDIVPAV